MFEWADNLKKHLEQEVRDYPVLNAVRRGDGATLASLIAAGADVEQCSPSDFRNPLALAFATCRNDLAKMLLEAGADPNAASRYGPVSMFGCQQAKGDYSSEQAMADSADALEMLAAHGADLTLESRLGGASMPVGDMLSRAARGGA
jgi:ankyrin repeat protein